MIPSLVVTSWPEREHERYGQQFLDGFRECWGVPWGVDLRCPSDGVILQDPAVGSFRKREAALKTCKDGDIHRDVLRWSWKVFALTMEPMPTEGWMLWIDGDVEFLKTPTEEFFDAVCPEDADVTYLGRPWTYASETGFVGYNMANPFVRHGILGGMRDMYLSGSFRDHPEWGDAGMFDWCRRCWVGGGKVRENNLAAHLTGPDMHVWPRTVLGELMIHHKGPSRKKDAYGKPS